MDFDAENRLLRITERGPNAEPISKSDYSYDPVGNRMSTTVETESTVSFEAYEYDAANQVTNVDSLVEGISTSQTSTKDVKFTYDELGNRINVSENGEVSEYTTNNLNQYTTIADGPAKYDRDGNLTWLTGWNYRYDVLGRLIEASNNSVTARFYYDSRNRVVAREYNDELTVNTYDDWKLIEERDQNNQLVALNIHGREHDEIVSVTTPSTTFYPHRDVLGNVSFLTDKSGKMIEQYSYSVEGTPTITDPKGQVLAESAVGNRWMYTEREWLAPIGLYDYRNRVYSSRLGRFLQPDPLRFGAGDMNIYRYVGNRYLNFTDAYGLVCGNGTWGDWLIPDGLPGVYNGSTACTLHDDLYSNGYYNAGGNFTFGSTTIYAGQYYTRQQSDHFFRDYFQYTNPGLFGWTFSYIYWGAVRLFGWLFWGGE